MRKEKKKINQIEIEIESAFWGWRSYSYMFKFFLLPLENVHIYNRKNGFLIARQSEILFRPRSTPITF
jgi:hypothetical protein